MGIQGLMKLIADYAPSAMKDLDIKNYFGGFLTCQIFKCSRLSNEANLLVLMHV